MAEARRPVLLRTDSALLGQNPLKKYNSMEAPARVDAPPQCDKEGEKKEEEADESDEEEEEEEEDEEKEQEEQVAEERGKPEQPVVVDSDGDEGEASAEAGANCEVKVGRRFQLKDGSYAWIRANSCRIPLWQLMEPSGSLAVN